MRISSLVAAFALADKSADAKGELPPSTCKQDNSAKVTCTAPVAGISNYTQGLEYMIWTQNDGHLMGYVAGPVHGDVWNWWVAVHHNIGIGGSPMNMNM